MKIKNYARMVGTAALAGTLALGGCAQDEGDMLEVTCDGKCDAFDELRAFWDDMKRVDLGDLASAAVDFVTDEVNEALEVADFQAIRLGQPEAYSIPEKAVGDFAVKNLNTMVDGLAARYGESDLTTEVAKIRRDYLQNNSNGDDYYGEASFSLNVGVDPKWNFDVSLAEEASVRVGFSRELSAARVVSVYDDEVDAFLQSPIAAIKRNFVLPGDTDELLDMRPGESFMVSGPGHWAFNFGAGVPLLVADPSTVSYRVVFSAAARVRLGGQRDIQIVRLNDNELVMDVGLSNINDKDFSLALRDGWGVSGLVESKTSIGGVELDLGKLADNALEDLLDKHLSFINGDAGYRTQANRVSVARFRIRPEAGQADGALGQAWEQAMMGDLRYLQSLANQDHPGVEAVFDFARTGVSTTMHAGLDLFGMSFFWGETEEAGSAVVQTPEKTLSYIFKTLQQESGWFFSSHGLLRVAAAGLAYDMVGGGAPVGETNLFINLAEGDKAMERDKMLDHYDGIIVAVAGEDALHAIEEKGNEMARFVQENCRADNGFDSCRVDIVNHPNLAQLRQEALVEFDREIANLPQAAKSLVLQAGNERLRWQNTHEFPATFTGPHVSILTNIRFDDASLGAIMGQTDGHALANAVTNYLEAVEVDRRDSESRIASDRSEIADDVDRSKIIEAYAKYAGRYNRLLGAEGARIESIGQVGPKALDLSFEVDAQNRPVYETAIARSLAKTRMDAATKLFDWLKEEVDGHRGSHIATYSFLALQPKDHLDMRVDVDVDLDNVDDTYREAGHEGYDLYVEGLNAKPMDGGMFSLEGLRSVDVD